uniref:NADAR domain-containing protein n=4 Tax=Parascaris univalens TaxID=6257 RepID=A0A915ALX9_PARUN
NTAMEDGKIVLIGNETDILHCGYSHALRDGDKRYPSADHYAHAMILTQLGLDEALILELLCTSSADVPIKARQLLKENMPTGHDMNSLATYLQTSRQSYTMQGLRLRVEQDAAFEKALMDTKDALLIVCDARDSELGIGMDEDSFVEWMGKEKADADMLSHWMRNERVRPAALGHNQLGYFLMWLRYEVAEKKRAKLLSTQPVEVDGISVDQDGAPVKITASDLVISLQGIFRPLSNYFALPFDMKGERYRSVEHYAYQRLFEALHLDDKCVEKIRTTVNPTDVAIVVDRVLEDREDIKGSLEAKIGRLDRWRQSAMKHKITRNETLQQLLLSTGHAILIDTVEGDPSWVSEADEFELQHLLTKQYITPSNIIDWMTERVKSPSALSHIRGNKTGLLLMELRAKLAASLTSQSRIPLVSALTSANELRTMISSHLICFTAESVFHPLYPAQIRLPGSADSLPSPTHYIAKQAIRYFGVCKDDAEWILESGHSVDCWHRMSAVIERSGASLERIQGWYMDERQHTIKVALSLMFDQHPSLMRALLDTGDALLVYCCRFASLDAELSIGMRERDLRAWLAYIDIDTKQLFDSVLRPMAFRPPYLGGNRLGCILMELRREFILKGVFPHQLPELPIGVDVILGSESPAENYTVSREPFSILSSDNFTALWANPFLLLAKQRKESDLWTQSNSKKTLPKLISMDESRLAAIIEELDANETAGEEELENYCCEELRGLFARLSTQVLQRMNEMEMQHNEMNLLAKQITQMQNTRRMLEERKRQMEGPPPSIPDHRERRDLGGMPPPLKTSPTPLLRSYSPPPPRRWEERRKPTMRRHSPEEKFSRRSPPEERPSRRRSPLQLKMTPVTPPRRHSPPPAKQHKPQKPPVDESELSEGEIVSD